MEVFYVLEDQEIAEEFRWIPEVILALKAKPYVWAKDRKGRDGAKW